MRCVSKRFAQALPLAASIAALTMVCAPAARGQAKASAAKSAPRSTGLPRIAGKPDFNGIWEANNTANWDLQNHAPRPIVGQPGFTPGSTVLAAPVVGLGAIGWVPGGLGVVQGDEIPYLPWAAARKSSSRNS